MPETDEKGEEEEESKERFPKTISREDYRFIKALDEIGEGSRVTFQLAEPMTIPVEPIGGGYKTDQTDCDKVTAELNIVHWATPGTDDYVVKSLIHENEMERIGLDKAFNHPDTIPEDAKPWENYETTAVGFGLSNWKGEIAFPTTGRLTRRGKTHSDRTYQIESIMHGDREIQRDR